MSAGGAVAWQKRYAKIPRHIGDEGWWDWEQCSKLTHDNIMIGVRMGDATRQSRELFLARPQETLCIQLQQQCSDWGVYWRAPDAHGVKLTMAQAQELLERALGVEVEIAQPTPAGKLVAWWNGIGEDITERSPYGPSIRWGAEAENSGHDIPLYDGYNPAHYAPRVVPDQNAGDGEYASGWNACRDAMLGEGGAS